MSIKYLIILFFSSFVYSQNCLDDAQINEQYFNDDIIGLYLSAIDFNSGESNFLFFDYSIDNLPLNADSTCVADDNNIKGSFKITFDISMFIDQYHLSPVKVADGNIRIYDIPNGLSSLSFRNTDLNYDTQKIQGASFELIDSQIYIESQQDDLTDLFIETGRVPNGRYFFNFTLQSCDDNDNNCIDIDGLNKQIDVFVPSYINLISPGSNSISDTLSNQISNTYPIFQWNSDYCSNCDFSIRIAEYKPLIHTSLEEAINDYSLVPLENGFYNLDNNSSVFQYPASGFENLIEGKYYVWQIKRSYNTTNGIFDDYSQIFIFKIASSIDNQRRRGVEETEYTLENIRLLIGETQYNNLFNNGGPLYGFTNVDSELILNGQYVSSNFLLELIQLLNADQIDILEVDVE